MTFKVFIDAKIEPQRLGALNLLPAKSALKKGTLVAQAIEKFQKAYEQTKAA